MSLPFLFFDVGGTLLHFRPSFVDVVARTCTELGVRVEEAEAKAAVMAALGEAGRGPDPVDVERSRRWWHVFFATLLDRLGHRGATEEVVAELWTRHQRGDWLTPAPDTISTLEHLANEGYRLGVISNWDHTLDAILERRGLLGFFEVVVASAGVGVAKPDAEIFRQAASRAGVEPQTAVHVGDDPSADVEGALGVGMFAVFLGSPWSLDGRANVATISTLADLPSVLARARLGYERLWIA